MEQGRWRVEKGRVEKGRVEKGGGEDPIPLGARYPSGSCLGQ